MRLPLFLFLALAFSGASGSCQQGVARPAITPTVPVAATPATSATGMPAASAVGPNYVLGPEDTIGITVWKEPTLTGSQVVRPDGRITLPLIGELTAAGLTPDSLSKEISEQLKKFITDPIVTVTVGAANSQRIYLVGEVVKQGPVMLSPDMTVLQAVASAGGLTAYANAKHMYILRGAKGKQQKIAFDYKKAVKQGNQQGLNLQAGDTLVIP